MDILVFTSKGDNFRINDVFYLKYGKAKLPSYDVIIIKGRNESVSIQRNQDIELVNVEVEDVGF